LFDHELLSQFVVAPSVAVVVVWPWHNFIALRLRERVRELGGLVVSGAAGLLLHHNWQWLRYAAYYSSPSDTPYHCATDSIPHTSTNPSSDGAADPSSASRRPFQLRC